MKKTLLEVLDERKIFKLVLGLGNQNYEEIESLVEIYARADADMIDINPSKEAVEAVLRGIEKAGKNHDEIYLSISTGVSGDTHIQKAVIDRKKCIKCGKCIKKCPQNAISFKDGIVNVCAEKCIGCKKCDFCKAISFSESQEKIEDIVKLANEYAIDCVELHLSTKEIPDHEIKYIINNSACVLSLCLDRKFYSNERLKKLINKVIKWNNGTDFIIQADGVPMSGGDDTFNSTLQAVAMAHLVQNFGTYILMSGGTNNKTSQLAKMCGLRYNGISVGSYARKITKGKNLDEAILEARTLIENCKNDY